MSSGKQYDFLPSERGRGSNQKLGGSPITEIYQAVNDDVCGVCERLEAKQNSGMMSRLLAKTGLLNPSAHRADCYMRNGGDGFRCPCFDLRFSHSQPLTLDGGGSFITSSHKN